MLQQVPQRPAVADRGRAGGSGADQRHRQRGAGDRAGPSRQDELARAIVPQCLTVEVALAVVGDLDPALAAQQPVERPQPAASMDAEVGGLTSNAVCVNALRVMEKVRAKCIEFMGELDNG